MNSVQLIGRLTKDPDLRYTNGGTEVCTLRLAVSRRRRDGNNNGAVYIDVVTWGNQANAVAQHLTKGRQVAVTGRLEYREWSGQDGAPHSRHEVVAEDVQFLDRPAKSDGGDNADAADDEESA